MGGKLILGLPEGHQRSKVDKWHLKSGMERSDGGLDDGLSFFICIGG